MIGQTLAHYRITEKIGHGGMGEVYKARDEHLDRDVAIKVLREDLASNPERLRRFEQEARSASALNHPNIIHIYDVGKHEDIHYIAMEYVEGQTLREVLAGGPLPTKKLIELGTQIAEGLAKSHAAGIIHRDLKPENVMITTDGYVKILDFGLAKLRTSPEADSEAVTATKQGSVMGTVGYMSPEQAKGQSVDHRSDQFSFGAILYEMITGKRAFQRETPVQTLSAIIEQEHDSIAASQPGTSTHLRAIVDRCLAKNPEKRYDSTRDLEKELKAFEDTRGPAEPRRAWPRLLFVGGAMTVLLILALSLNFGGLRERLVGTPAPRIESLAVLPLENLSGDLEQDIFADGMTEALIAELGQLGTIRVISRTSVMMYKGKRKPLPEIARELNVDAVIEGSVFRSEDRVRITAQLVRVSPEEHLWAQNYDRDYGEVLTLQSEIALAVAREIESTLSPQMEARLGRSRTVVPEAYEAYLKGRYYVTQRTDEGLRRSREYFQRAIDIDPTYAPAYAGLSEYYGLQTFVNALPTKEWLPLAEAAAQKALALDAGVAEAHTMLGIFHFHYDWKWFEAEEELKTSIALNPNNAYAHQAYAAVLALVMGRLDEAVGELDRAIEIDPLTPLTGAGGGLYLFTTREYERALSYLNKALEVNPDYPVARYTLGLIYAQRGSLSEAISELKEAVSGGLGPTALADLGRAYALMGETAKAYEILDQLLEPPEQIYAPPFEIALVYIGLGEVDKALDWMEKAYEDRSVWMSYSREDPRLDPLRSEPRFQELMRRMNFPE